MGRPIGTTIIMPNWKTPSRPASLLTLGLRSYSEDGNHWTDQALALMDKAFCEAVSKAHPEKRVAVW